MDALPYPYEEPNGFILLAKVNNDVAGCVALKPLPDALNVSTTTQQKSKTTSADSVMLQVCEMKRLFVSDRFKRMGIGKALVKACIQEATLVGYGVMVLDTRDDSHFAPAQAIYEMHGFRKRTSSYYDGGPQEGLIFFELELQSKP